MVGSGARPRLLPAPTAPRCRSASLAVPLRVPPPAGDHPPGRSRRPTARPECTVNNSAQPRFCCCYPRIGSSGSLPAARSPALPSALRAASDAQHAASALLPHRTARAWRASSAAEAAALLSAQPSLSRAASPASTVKSALACRVGASKIAELNGSKGSLPLMAGRIRRQQAGRQARASAGSRQMD